MPYLIITDKQHELDRHDLKGSVIVGRAPDCGVVVRDILLSRHHCRIEPNGTGWVVVDLGSKNGTYMDGEKIEQRALDDADVVYGGRTRIIFKTGKFIPPPPDVIERKSARRPADPIEALAGTMVGFVLTDMEENSRVTGFPIPKPKKAEPARKREPIEHDMKKPAVIPPEYYDLELREPAPMPTRAVAAVDAPKTIATPAGTDRRDRPARSARSTITPSPRRALHHEPPREFATAPRWFALLYVLIAYLVCALIVWMFLWR